MIVYLQMYGDGKAWYALRARLRSEPIDTDNPPEWRYALGVAGCADMER